MWEVVYEVNSVNVFEEENILISRRVSGGWKKLRRMT